MDRLRLLPLLAVLALLIGAPLQAAPLNLVGTGDGLEIFRELAKVYAGARPGEEVNVPPSIGSGGAIAAVGAGSERIGRIARDLTASERASGLAARPVFEIPSAFYVHPSVSVRALSSTQLRAIFMGSITNWAEVGGANQRIRVVRREEADSTLTSLRANLPAFHDAVITERSKLALTTQEALLSVSENEGAIGFAPYSTRLSQSLGVVAVDGHAPGSAGYPAKVRLSIIWHENARDAQVEGFLAFLASPRALEVITRYGALAARP